MENPLIAMNYRQIQAQKEYAILITKRASDLVLDIIKRCPSKLLVENNNFTSEYFFLDKWRTLSELSDWVYNRFFASELKELKNMMKIL